MSRFQVINYEQGTRRVLLDTIDPSVAFEHAIKVAKPGDGIVVEEVFDVYAKGDVLAEFFVENHAIVDADGQPVSWEPLA